MTVNKLKVKTNSNEYEIPTKEYVVPMEKGGTGATDRLTALKNLTNENVGATATYFFTLTDGWASGGYSSLADARSALKISKIQSASWATTSSSTKLKININSTAPWMLNFTVILYNGYRATKVMISGYQYGANYWYSPSAIILGDSGVGTLNVYFGYDAVNKLWVGFDGGSYTGIAITDVCNGYEQVGDVANLFTISNVSSLATLQKTVTATSGTITLASGIRLS